MIVVFFSRTYRISICPIIGDANFGYLFKVVSAKLIHSKVTDFPFVINKQFVGDTLRLWKYPVPHQPFTCWHEQPWMILDRIGYGCDGCKMVILLTPSLLLQMLVGVLP